MSSKENQPRATIEDDGVLLAMHLATISFLPMTAKVAIELNVFEIISKAGPGAQLSPKEIASHLPAKNPDAPAMLDRILRLLASHSVLSSSIRIHDSGLQERLYGLGPVAKYLVKNEDGVSLSPYVALTQDKVPRDAWLHLKDAILDGGIAFNKAYGVHAFDYTGIDPRFNQVFNEGMSVHSAIFLKTMLETYKGFDGLQVVVDVGGGLGNTIGVITSKYPTLHGINFDLPHVIEQAPSYPGVKHIGGDMFESVPNGDAIFLKWILHDWSDESCLKLLKNCYKALPENGKLVVVDALLPDQVENDTSAKCLYQLDLIMMTVNPGGKERTEEELATLTKAAGFAPMNKVCFIHNNWVMEFYKM